MKPLVQVRRFLFTVPLNTVFITVLHAQRPIYASELIQDYFLDDARIKQYMQKVSGQEDALINKKDIDEFRKGICLAWDNYRRYPSNQGIKDLCKNLISGNASSRRNSLPTEPSPSNTNSHSACLNAKDYEGCMRYQAGRSDTKADNCKPGKWCKALGLDILGKPKIEGWWMKSTPESQSVGYLRPRPRKVLVRGKTDRYIAREMVIRYCRLQELEQLQRQQRLAPRLQTVMTRVIQLLHNHTSDNNHQSWCSGSARGVVQYSFTTVIDCQEKTVGNHRGSQLDGKWVD